jgi:hypothetical protein
MASGLPPDLPRGREPVFRKHHVQDQMEVAACRNNGIFAGCGGNRDVARQVDLIKRGCQFVTTQSDIGFLAAAASAWTAGIRDGLA